jgi:membrane peptidoglycan carboxypeptidase
MNEPEYEIKTISKSQPDKFIMLSKPSGAVSALWASTPALLSARRNFGSAVKPLLVYMPALEFGMITPDSKINDSPITAGDFRPQNIGGKYYGTVSVREAVTKSLNIPAIKIMDMTGVENACSVAKKLGLSLGDENLSAALGNTSLGISFLELSGAYQTAANGGKSATPRFIKSIKDRNGKIVYQDTSGKYNYAPTAVSENTAYLMTDMLLDVTRFGTGKKLSYLGIDIASKTGTTQRDSADTNTDITFVSYTPNDVLIAWKGNADMKPQNDLPKGTLGGASLGFTVREIHKHISDKNVHFKKPASIIAKEATASLLSTALAVDGKTENNDTSQIWFDTKSNQTYEIYKNDVLQEVITGKNERHYFKDKNPSKKNVYKVISLDNDNKIQSSEIVLPWYF